MRRTLVPALAGVLVLALVGFPGIAGAQASWTARNAAARAVAWLASQQQPDGGFELAGFPGFETPDAVLAIAESAQVSDTWDATRALNAVTRITRNANNALHNLDDLVDSGTSGGQAAKLIVLAVTPLGLNPHDFDPDNDSVAPVDLVSVMDAAKLPDGSYGAGTFNATLYAPIASKLLGRTAPADTLAYIAGAQQANGNWNYTGTASGTGVDVDTTALALVALAAGGRTGTDPVVTGGLAALAAAQFTTGGWGDDYGAGPEVNTNSTALAAIGIKAAGADPGTRTWRDTAAPSRAAQAYVSPETTLISKQKTDGHFTSPFDSYGLNTSATSQAVQGLLLNWLPIAAAPVTPPSGGVIDVALTGGVNATVSGPLTSGSVAVAQDSYGLVSVTGSGAVGSTNVSFNLKRFWILKLYSGSIGVRNGAGVDVTALLFFSAGSYAPATNTASGSGPWFHVATMPWRSGQVTWSVTPAV